MRLNEIAYWRSTAIPATEASAGCDGPQGSKYWHRVLVSVLVGSGVWALIFGLAPTASATDVGSALSIIKYEQNQSNWCWATAAETAVKYLTGVSYSQCSMVKLITPTNTCDNIQEPDSQVYYLILQYLSSAAVLSGHLPYSTLTAELNGFHPVLAHITWSTGGGHMVTIFAYENATNSGTAAGTVIDYSNADGAVGTGTNATVGSMTLSNFWSNSGFSQYSSISGLRA